MAALKGLIIKDFQTIKSYKTTILFMIVLFTIGGFLNDDIITFIPVTMPLCFEMLAMSGFSFDNLSNSDTYIRTLPVNKKDIVKARYIYILLFTLFGSLFGLICTILVQLLKTKNIGTEILISDLSITSGAFVGIMFVQIFQIPIMYKFGAEKGRIIQLVMIIVLMLGISLATTAIMKIWGISLDNLAVMLKDYLIAVLGIMVILLYILSFVISRRIYERKEI